MKRKMISNVEDQEQLMENAHRGSENLHMMLQESCCGVALMFLDLLILHLFLQVSFCVELAELSQPKVRRDGSLPFMSLEHLEFQDGQAKFEESQKTLGRESRR